MVQTALGAVLPRQVVHRAVRRVYSRVEPELARLAEFAPRGGTAVDVGAWYGPWTARLVGYADRVVAVEANPDLAARLRAAFPAVTVVPAAASDVDGPVDLWFPGTGLGADSVASLRRPESGGYGVTVPRVRLDDLDLGDVRFVKMDIEGHELAALRGAERVIRRDRPVLMLELECRHQPVEPVVELLTGWGYAGAVLPSTEWVPLDGFDLVAHQRATEHVVRRSFLRRLLPGGPRYVNSVLFRPL